MEGPSLLHGYCPSGDWMVVYSRHRPPKDPFRSPSWGLYLLNLDGYSVEFLAAYSRLFLCPLRSPVFPMRWPGLSSKKVKPLFGRRLRIFRSWAKSRHVCWLFIILNLIDCNYINIYIKRLIYSRRLDVVFLLKIESCQFYSATQGCPKRQPSTKVNSPTPPSPEDLTKGPRPPK